MHPPVETRSKFQFEFKRLYFSNLEMRELYYNQQIQAQDKTCPLKLLNINTDIWIYR